MWGGFFFRKDNSKGITSEINHIKFGPCDNCCVQAQLKASILASTILVICSIFLTNINLNFMTFHDQQRKQKHFKYSGDKINHGLFFLLLWGLPANELCTHGHFYIFVAQCPLGLCAKCEPIVPRTYYVHQ